MEDKVKYQVYSPYSDISNPFSDSNYEEYELENGLKYGNNKSKSSGNIFYFLEFSDIFMVVVASLLMCCSAVSTPVQTMIYGNIFSKLSNFLAGAYSSFGDFKSEILLSCGIIMLLGLVKMITLWIGVSLWMILGERQQRRARKLLFYSSFYKDIEWYDTTHNLMGEVAQINRCIEEIRSGTAEVTALLIQNLASVISLFINSMINSWSLTLIILASSPIMAIVSVVFGKLIYSAAAKENAKSAKASKVVDWFLESRYTVRLFNGKYTDIIRFNKLVDLTATEFFRFAHFASGNVSILKFLSLMMFVQGFWFGNYMIQEGKLTINALFTCFTSCLLLGASIFEISSLLNVILKSKVAMVELQRFIEINANDDVCTYDDSHECEGIIEFDKVNFRYSLNTNYTLNDVQIKIKPNEFNFIIGRSGSGKSTLVNLLLNFYKPTSGIIRIDGKNLMNYSKKWISDNITLIQQKPTIFHLNLKDNIGIAISSNFESLRNIPNYMIVEASIFAQLGSLIDQLDSGLYTNLTPSSLSGGQKQRVAIARAKIRNTPILILDEALSALDTRTRNTVLTNIRKWRLGKTTIYITHDFTQINPGDYIIMLDNGSVYYDGYYSPKKYENVRLSKQLQTLQRNKINLSDSKPTVKKSFIRALDVSEPEKNVKILSIFFIMKYFFKSVGNKLTVLVGLFFALLCGISGPVFSFAFSKLLSIMLDASLGKNIRHDLTIWSCIVMVISLFDSLTYYFSSYLLLRVSEQYVNQVRKMVFASLSLQDVSFFDSNNNSAGLTALIMNDTRDFRNLLAEFMTITVNLISMVILGVLWSLLTGWKLALVGFSFIPLISLLTGIYSRMLEKSENNYKTEVSVVENHNHEAISEIKSILNLYAVKFFIRQFEYKLGQLKKIGVSRAIYTGFGISLYELCSAVTIGVILYYGLQLVGNLEYSTEQLLQVITMVNFTIVNSSVLLRQYPDLAKGQRAATYIINILQLHPSYIENNGIFRPSLSDEKLVKFDKVYFRYVSNTSSFVLQNISFEVYNNEILAVVGESGSGKTTIASLLMRLQGATSGKIEVANIKIEELDIDWLRDTVSIVPQCPVFFEGSIYENLIYGLTHFKIIQADINESLKLSGIFEDVNLLSNGINTSIGEGNNSSFSSGQLQRLAIARALIRNPSILILDECTSNLDYENMFQIRRLIQTMITRKKLLTIILITHDQAMMKIANRMIVLKSGLIVEEGDYATLYGKKGELYNIINNKQ